MTPNNLFRTDIQALRGVAVLFVVFYHAKIFDLKAGFLGVDIFFVISGFLITNVITNAISNGSFSFKAFYLRRAARLLPAAYATFLLTALSAPLFLSEQQLNDLTGQLLGSIAYIANIVLWQQSDYFAGEAALKPLLHIWSLSLEEQYYFLLPLLFFITPQKHWKRVTITLLVTSFILCVIAVSIKPVATFYLLPTRAWELMIGSLLAIFKFRLSASYGKILFWPAVIALLMTPIYSTGLIHPGVDALIICLATAIIIAVQHPKAERHLLTNGLAFFGGFSYSLYLVHWPIFAFLNNAYIVTPSLNTKILALTFSLILGYFLYYFIEKPMRKQLSFSSRNIVFLISLSCAICLIPSLAIISTETSLDYSQLRQPNYGLDKRCNFEEEFTAIEACQSSGSPVTLIWGDSFAMHLISAIKISGAQNITQATSAMCGPMLGIAPFDGGSHSKAWAKKCIKFNQSVMDYVSQNDSIKNIVMSSQFFVYVKTRNWNREYNLIKFENNAYEVIDSSVENSVKALKNTIKALQQMGKFVTVVAPPPSSGFNIGSCVEKKYTNKITIGGSQNCNISMKNYSAYQFEILELLSKIENVTNVIYLSEGLCDKTRCITEKDGIPYYLDDGHLSIAGSQYLGAKMQLANKIKQQAIVSQTE